MELPGNKKGVKKMAVPCVYDGQEFPSITALCEHLGVQKGYTSWYIKNDKPLRGHYIDFKI